MKLKVFKCCKNKLLCFQNVRFTIIIQIKLIKFNILSKTSYIAIKIIKAKYLSKLSITANGLFLPDYSFFE